MGLQRGIYTRIFLERNGDGPWPCFGCEFPVSREELNVHHENENHWDHSPENLVAMHRPCHTRLHHLGKSKHALRRDTKTGFKGVSRDTRRANCFGARYNCLECGRRLYVPGRWKTAAEASLAREQFIKDHEHEIYAEGRR